MTVHHESYSVTDPFFRIDAVPSGSLVGEDTIDDGHVALVISAGAVGVLYGPKGNLLAALRKAVTDLEALDPNDPIPADYAPEDDEDEDEG